MGWIAYGKAEVSAAAIAIDGRRVGLSMAISPEEVDLGAKGVDLMIEGSETFKTAQALNVVYGILLALVSFNLPEVETDPGGGEAVPGV
jgi:hypothetical protein